MIPYLDGGFLLTLVIRTNGSEIAAQTLRRFEWPVYLNSLHQLQAHSLLLQQTKSGNKSHELAGHQGQMAWEHYFSEGVFQLASVDWDRAFISAVTWTKYSKTAPPPPLLVLHPALALTSGASHFLSFDPRSRGIAKAGGLKVLPERV